MSDYTFKFTNPLTPVFVVKPYTANGPQTPLSTSLYINPVSSVHAVSANTPLVLTGKGVPEYGEMVQNNLVYLAENFAGPTRPQPSLKGMLWYKDTNGVDPLFPSDPASTGMYLWNTTSWKTVLVNGEITTPIDAGNQRITNVGLAVNPNDAVSVAYLTTSFLPLGGGTISGNIVISSGYYISASEPPVLGSHLTNKLYVDTNDTALQASINLTYTTLSGQITTLQSTDTMLSGQITTLQNDVIIGDQALDARIDALVSGTIACLPLAGGVLTGPVIFGDNFGVNANSSISVATGGTGTIMLGNRVIQSVAEPIISTDAATKHYVDSNIITAINNIVFPPSTGSSDGVTNDGLFTPTDSSGYQVVAFSVGKSSGAATGLANNATVYTATITVDGTVKNISVVGGSAQTYSTLFTEINADLAGSAVCSFTNTGYIKITSNITGTASSISITNIDLFSSLTDYITISPAINGIKGGTLTLYRTAGLPSVEIRGLISPFNHVHNLNSLLYDLSREYGQSSLQSTFVDIPSYPNIALSDVIMVMDQLIYALNVNPSRQIITAAGGQTNYTFDTDVTFEVGSNNLQIFFDGVKKYCDERGTSTLTFNQPNVGLRSLVPITAGSYHFNLTWNGTLTNIPITVTANYTYLQLLNDLYAAVSSLPTSTSGKEDVNFSVLASGAAATGLVGATQYAAKVTVDGTIKQLLITGANASTFTTLVSEINVDLAGTALAVLDVGNKRIRITSVSTGENSSVSIADDTVNPLFSSVNNFTTINGTIIGWQPVGIVNIQQNNQLIIKFLSSQSGGPGSSMVVSYGAGELFEQIDSCSPPVNTSISGTLGYAEVGVPGTLSNKVTFHTAVPINTVMEIISTQ